jgi:hypothetical protein
VLRDPTRRIAEAGTARQRVEDGYSLGKMIGAYERLYRGEDAGEAML